MVLAIGFFPSGQVGAAELAGEYSTARQLYEARRYGEARTIFARLLTDQPESVEINFYLGRLALWFDDGPAALAHLQNALRRAPDDARIHNALGDAYGLTAQNVGLLAKLGWARKCLGAYETAVRLSPNLPRYRWSLLGYYCVAPRIAGGGCEKAQEQAEAISRLDPVEGRWAFATYYLSQRKASLAFAQFDEMLNEKGDDFLSLYQVGRCAAVSGEQLDRGRQALERCLTLIPPGGDGMPTLASVHYRLGNVLEKLSLQEAAQQHYQAVAKILPDFRPEKETLRN